MFRHKDAIFREFNNNKRGEIQQVLQVLVAVTIFIKTLKANSHKPCRSHAAPMPFPCHAVPLRV
jgi:hypothetical protein